MAPHGYIGVYISRGVRYFQRDQSNLYSGDAHDFAPVKTPSVSLNQ